MPSIILLENADFLTFLLLENNLQMLPNSTLFNRTPCEPGNKPLVSSVSKLGKVWNVASVARTKHPFKGKPLLNSQASIIHSHSFKSGSAG